MLPATSNFLSVVAFFGDTTASVVNGVITVVIGFVVSAVVTYLFGFPKEKKAA